MYKKVLEPMPQTIYFYQTFGTCLYIKQFVS
jgi:hypothetical protein